MRCLQCGKDLPLLRRMAGSEFCSEAHRREYQTEYSELALGRLLQSKPAAPEKNAEVNGAATLLNPAATTNGHSASIVTAATPAVHDAQPVVARSKVMPGKSSTTAKTAEPWQAIPLPPAPSKTGEAEPAIATAAKTPKPTPAALRWAVAGTAELEQSSSPRPGIPHREASVAPAALLEASTFPLECGVEIANATITPMELQLEQREPARPVPRIDLDLRIVGPGSWEVHGGPLVLPAMSSMAPEEGALWTADYKKFAAPEILPGNFAMFQLSTTGWQPSTLAGHVTPAHDIADAAGSAADTDPGNEESSPIGELPGSEPSTADTPAEGRPREAEAPMPERVLEPLPMVVQGIAAGRAKATQVFGAALFNAKTIQIPQPSGLPLRPVMVLGPAEAAAAPVAGKKRKADVRILPPASIPTQPPAAEKPVADAAPEFVVREVRLQPPQDAAVSRMPKIMAAVAGAAVIGFGIFFFTGRSESGSQAKVEASTAGENWISNFAPDAKLQRKVSVLRSSMSLPAYRLDFESSIQIKGLGWVYRAQDANNFYVSKIELEKPGQNPTFVIAHYAVIDGVEQPRVETPLRVGVPLGGHYKIRFDAVGDRFTTWVQGQPVDQWTDARLKTGGAGLYKEGAEQFTVHGNFQVTPLVNEKQ